MAATAVCARHRSRAATLTAPTYANKPRRCETTAADAVDKALAALFTETSRAVAHRLQAAGLPYTVNAERTIIERDSPTRWSASKRVEARNILATGPTTLPGAPLLGEKEIASVHRCAVALAELAREALPYWVPFPGPVGPLTDVGLSGLQWENDPAGWVARVIVLPALFHHLAGLPSLDHADEAAAQRFAKEVLRIATAANREYLLSVPLSGVDLDGTDTLAADSVRVRQLSAVEQGAIFDQRGGPVSLTTNFNELPCTVLEFQTSGPRKEQFLRSHELVMPLITAFQLHGFHLAGHDMAERAEPQWVFAGVSHHPLVLPKQPRQSTTLTAEIFQAITDTGKQLERYHLSEPISPQDLALHRFATGLARDTYADGVLDFAIVLESLLLPYDRDARRGDLGYRFRVHGAHYLTERADQRSAITKQLSNIYEIRSRLVHGAKYPGRAQTRAAYDAAYDFARCGLLRAVKNGFPTAKTFNEMVLR